MIMHVPVKPFANEYALGWRGRLKFLNHYPNVKTLVDDLRRDFSNRHNGGLACDVPLLYVYAEASGMSEADFLANHTLIPFFRAFDVKNFGGNGWGKQVVNFIKYRGLSSTKKSACFCIECVEDDLRCYGIPYWHREHQLPAVDWCPTHGHKLKELALSAFDNPPPISNHSAPNSDLGALDRAHSIIQRYVATSDYVLNRGGHLDFHLVSHFLERKAMELGMIGPDGSDLCLNSTVKNFLPGSWLGEISGGFNRGNYDLDLTSVFRRGVSQRATEIYVLLFALFYESIDEIKLQFEKIDHVNNFSDLDWGRCSSKFFLDELIYSEYVRCGGSVSDVVASGSFSLPEVEKNFGLNGLPPLCGERGSDIRALSDFFQGKPLSEVCSTYNVEIDVLERLLRCSGARVARALSEIGKRSSIEKV